MQKETIIQGMLMCLSYLGHLCLDLILRHMLPSLAVTIGYHGGVLEAGLRPQTIP